MLSAFESRKVQDNEQATNENALVQELYNNLEENVWYEYLYKINKDKKMRGINWIDFESEISFIVEKLDRQKQNLYALLDSKSSFEDEKVQWFLDKFKEDS